MFGLFFRPFHFRGYTLNSYGRLHMVRLRTSNLLDPGDLPLIYQRLMPTIGAGFRTIHRFDERLRAVFSGLRALLNPGKVRPPTS